MTEPALVSGVLVGSAVFVLVGVPAPRRIVLAASRRQVSWARATLVLLPALLFALEGLVAALLGLVASLVAGRAWRRRGAARTRQDERRGAGEALAVLSSELRAGRTPAAALVAAADVATGPLATALRGAGGSDRVGADPVTCLLRGVPDSAVPEVLRGLAACWQVCASTGSSLAAAVERLAESLRADQVQRQAIDAELAGPRATAAMLATLPVAGIALAAGLGARPLHVLLHTPVGLGCLMAGLALDALGLWWTGRLVRAAGGMR